MRGFREKQIVVPVPTESEAKHLSDLINKLTLNEDVWAETSCRGSTYCVTVHQTISPSPEKSRNIYRLGNRTIAR